MYKSLSSNGYSLKKLDLSTAELNDLQNELTVTPYTTPDYAVKPQPFKVYQEGKTKIYLPKYFGLQKYGLPDIDKIDDGDDIELSFTGTLRKEQLAPIEEYMKAAKNPLKRGGILNLRPGFGKTTMAINILCTLKKKTLIIVHKEFLMEQWKERIEQFAQGARIGYIKGPKVDYKNKDIVIGMLQSLSMKEYDEEVFKGFGFVVIDECHHMAAEVFSKALRKVNFKYALGLSATVKRKDGLAKVFIWHIGDIVFKTKKNVDNVLVLLKEYDTSYCTEIRNNYNKLNVPLMVNKICEYMPRVLYIIDTLEEVLKSEPDRKVILLSDRRNHLQLFKKELDKRNITNGYVYGGLKPIIIEESQKQQVILATFAYCCEGYDCPGLNTMILASPKTELEQIIGRIQRDKPECRKYTPMVIDIIDNFSLFAQQAKKRQKYYKARKYEIIGYKEEKLPEINFNGTCFITDE
jgi:superfamily II DNA or RNA helicase